MTQFEIHSLTLPEVSTAIDWAAAEGWNPGLGDAEAFRATDPEGFLGGFLDGELIATISAVRYPKAFAFIGFYIVHPNHRGQGYGTRLWKHALDRVKDCNVGLDGVLAQVPNYEKSGFHLAYHNRRYEGRGTVTLPDGLETITSLSMQKLVAFDGEFFPSLREDFLRAWLAIPGAEGYQVQREGRLEGYGIIRPCRSGWKIGPLFACTPEIAKRLFHGLAFERPGPVYLDVPDNNHEGVSLAERMGMKLVFETARMYTQAPPNINLEGVFGVTSFELG